MHIQASFAFSITITTLIIITRLTEGTAAAAAGERIGFWHVTDFHLDPDYDPHGVASQYCHYVNQSVAQNLGVFGDWRCDSPYVLAASAVNAMKQKHPDARFILWTGDTAPHLPDTLATTQSVIHVIQNLTALLEKAFPTTPLYPAFGNHDFWPTDQFEENTNRIYQAAETAWGKHLNDPEARRTLREHGYYRINLEQVPSTVLLSLNTILWYKPNRNINASITDPANQFIFLKETLENARTSKTKVLIASHVPPGSWELRAYSMIPDLNKRFLEIIANYSDVISGLYFGHTHRDLFMFVKDKQNAKLVQLLLTAPGVVPWHGEGRNPAIRFVEVDAATGDLRHIRQYFLNLSEANQQAPQTSDPQWQLHYDWQIPDGQSSLQFFAEKFGDIKANRNGAFDGFRSRATVGAPLPACDQSCFQAYVCKIGELDYAQFDKCISSASSAVESVPTHSNYGVAFGLVCFALAYL